MENFLIQILVVLLVAGLTAVLTWRTTVRHLELKYITDERKKWREGLRNDIVAFIHTPNLYKRKETFTKIKMNLNPLDKHDNNIIQQMEKVIYISGNEKECSIKELEFLVQCLLKHDWERAKSEANNNSIFNRKAKIKRRQSILLEGRKNMHCCKSRYPE